MSEPENSLRQVFEAYRAAVFAKDVEAFVALFDSEVRIFDTWDQWSRDGLDSWRDLAVDWFQSLGSERVMVDIEDLRTIVTDGIAVAHSFVRYGAVSPDGAELRSLVNRQTWVLVRAGTTWKIIHAHSSTPVEHGTLKAILQR